MLQLKLRMFSQISKKVKVENLVEVSYSLRNLDLLNQRLNDQTYRDGRIGFKELSEVGEVNVSKHGV